MLLGFVGGVMNIAFMGLATILMVLEKLPEIGRWLTRPLGVALLAAAAWIAVTGL
jgi:predicted metal-binding membrane protein